MESYTRDDFDRYKRRTHVWGRLSSLLILLMLLGAPFLIGAHLGGMPDLAAAARAFFTVGLVWTVSRVAEYLIYTPVLGAGGGYLAFITGNILNVKLPSAANARDIAGVKAGTPESEIASTLSIAAASLMTIAVLAVGVVLLVPLQPLLQSPALQPAFDCVVPALFGAMAYKYYRGNLSLAAPPLLLMCLLFVLVPSLIGSASMMILPAGGLAIALAYLQFKREAK